ncbi:MAG: DUF1553 domain-containing protein [Planctomycetaceae bacterium]|nr:DUF1553 domain-containing protein [Planctomycetaceae bacterium]
MLRRHAVVIGLFLLLSGSVSSSLADAPAIADVTRQIDNAVTARWQAENVQPAAPLDDGLFLRRVMLDLAGRVPTVQEWNDYVNDSSADKKQRLVSRLIESPDFAFHQRNELDLLLLARLTNNGDWRNYLLEASRDNRPWDQIFQEVVLPEVHQPENLGTAAFLRERVRELDDLTNDTAVLFFGVNISCAKCHDHPLVADWQQDHYFGMASFFQRTYKTKTNFLSEKFDGRLNFKTVEGEEKPAQFMFLTGTTIDEPTIERTEDELKELQEAVKKAEREDDAEVPQPDFRPRSELVRLALNDQEKHFFSRNIVNRVWARLMGRGFVEPLDQMHSDNTPSHPELLEWLALDLEQNGYNLKRLMAGIVLSEPYALSSKWTDDERPSPELFAAAEPRPLNPRQLALSTIVATMHPQQAPGLEKPEDWEKTRENWENRSNHLAGQLPIPDENFQVSVEEALMFSNNDHVANEYLRDSGDRLIGAMKELETVDQKLDLLFQSVFARHPNDAERTNITKYVSERSDRETAAWQQVLWALLTSPEFRFNH